MSIPSPPLSPPPTTLQVLMAYGAITVSLLTGAAFFIALVVSYLLKDQQNLLLMIGAVIANFSTVVSFWLGSSAGSQKKDDALAAKQTPTP